ncbi:hypothetical protein QQF64_036322 [Cirrhinus molitorella]|uniref:Uncharacterized protein n=1 Tax=Cirrhinus molitorella TaxID=172907 RepID=A0ABR3NIF3_9TELE
MESSRGEERRASGRKTREVSEWKRGASNGAVRCGFDKRYVDDLCLAACDEATCVADTVTLLKHLAEEGHKASLSKLQFVKQQPLRSLTLGKGLKSTDKVKWTAEAEEAFVNMKIQLSQAPALGLPNADKPFVQMVDEKNGFMTSVLLQHHGDKLRPVAYFSSKLDPVAAGPQTDPQTGLNKVGYAITTEFEVVASGKLPSNYSAQAAELVALTEACKLMKDKCVTIYTDSRYAFGVTHDFGALWKHRKFLKSDGRPILNARLVAELLEAILLSERIAICKCAAHTNNKDFHRACRPWLQGQRRSNGRSVAVKWRMVFGGVRMADLVYPSIAFLHYSNLTHGFDHVSKAGMLLSIKRLWFTKGFTIYAEKFCKRCVICNTHNVARGVKMPLTSQPPSAVPFEYLQMDFVELNPCEGKKYCLVMVDMWSKWTEVFPSSKQDAAAVAKAPLTEIVPRWGIPWKISSDNFVNGGEVSQNATI